MYGSLSDLFEGSELPVGMFRSYAVVGDEFAEVGAFSCCVSTSDNLLEDAERLICCGS